MTRQLTALEENGFVTRRRSTDDRRTVEVYPTDKAQAVLPAVQEARRKWRSLLLEDMSDTEREALDQLLARLADRAESLI